MTAHLNSIPLVQINEENLPSLLEAAKNYKSMNLLNLCCDFLNNEVGIGSSIWFEANESGDLTVSLLVGRELIADIKFVRQVAQKEKAVTSHRTPKTFKKPFEKVSTWQLQ